MMDTQEAKRQMDDMWLAVDNLKLPQGFEANVYVPMEVANLMRAYYSHQEFSPFQGGSFAAGEPFRYKGIKCFATPPEYMSKK